jgi:hypothetical protein
MRLAVALLSGLTAVTNPHAAHHAQAAGPVQTVIVAANDPHGANSAPLEAYAAYRIRASGTFGFGAGEADAECTTSNTSVLNPAVHWLRHRYPVFFAEDPVNLVASDFWDPDPTDDAADLYVDHKNVEWIPSTPAATSCDETQHAYETTYVPTETRPLNLSVFDIAYTDNTGGLTVTIEQIAGPAPLPAHGRHLETLLVHSGDVGGPSTAPLADGRDFLFVVHGTWIYDTRDFSSVADAECARTSTDPQYLRHRFGDDPLDVVVNGSPIEWHGVGPETPVPGAQGCNSPTHVYWVIGIGHGVPVGLSIADSNHGDNAGTLSVDVYQLD